MCPYTSIHNPLRIMCQPPFTTWAPGWFRVIEDPRILKKTPSEATNFMFGCAGLMHLPSTPLDDLSRNMGILTEEIQSLLYDCTFDYMDVSENSGTPKASILIGFSIINHPFWGTTIFGNIHIYLFICRKKDKNLFGSAFYPLLKTACDSQTKPGKIWFWAPPNPKETKTSSTARIFTLCPLTSAW